MSLRTNWPTVKLGDHVDLLTGFPFKSAQFSNDPQDIPLVKGENVQQGYIDWEKAKRWTRVEWESFTKFQLRSGDVVLAMDRPWIEAGLKYGWIRDRDPKALLVQRVSRMRGKDGLRADFLRYIIGSPAFTDYIRPIVTGINVPHISPAQIKDYKFPLPTNEVQRCIASILSAYDDLIENNTRRIAVFEEIARRLYEEWFVHFRFPGHEQVRMVKSELGLIPDGWKVATVGDCTIVHRGKSYKSSELAEEGGLPFVNLKCMERDGGFRKSGLKRFIGPYNETHKVTVGDMVMAVTDMTQERRIVARCGRIPRLDAGFGVISMDLVRLEPRPLVPRDYLYGMFRWSGFADEVKQHANGANVLHLLPDRISDYKLANPSQELMERFATAIGPMLQQEDVLGEKNDNLRAQRNLLLPKLISGEIDVSEFPEAETIAA